MDHLRKFIAQPLTRKLQLVYTSIVVWLIRLGLMLLPFRVIRRAINRLAGPPVEPYRTDAMHRENIAWAVNVVGRYVLGDNTCLTQALAAELLLRRRGYRAHTRIGVAKGYKGNLEAHAWVESDGQVVVGGPRAALTRYTVMSDSFVSGR